MRKRLWDLAKSRIEIGTILPGHRHKVSDLVLGLHATRGLRLRLVSTGKRNLEAYKPNDTVRLKRSCASLPTHLACMV